MNFTPVAFLIVVLLIAAIETFVSLAIARIKRISHLKAALLTSVGMLIISVGAWSLYGLLIGVMAAGPLGIFGIALFVQQQAWTIGLVTYGSLLSLIFLKLWGALADAKVGGASFWLVMIPFALTPTFLISRYAGDINQAVDLPGRVEKARSQKRMAIRFEELEVLNTSVEKFNEMTLLKVRVRNNSASSLELFDAKLTINQCKAGNCKQQDFPFMRFFSKKGSTSRCPPKNLEAHSDGDLFSQQALARKTASDETFEVVHLQILQPTAYDGVCEL